MSDGTSSNQVSTPSKTALQDSTSESISSNSGNIAKADAKVEDRTGLYLAIVAFAVSFLSLGMQLSSKQGEDDRVRAAVAEAEARMAEKLAQANETANSARTFGRLANEKSDRVLAQLEVRGLVKPENH